MIRAFALLLLIWNGATRAEIWVLIDTVESNVQVLDDNTVIRIYDNASFGRNGYGIKQKLGDDTTPLGEFHVAWFNPDSRYELFIGIDYPNIEYAERGLASGLINEDSYNRIKRAINAGQKPPQNTALGGALGVHGIGRGDPRIHADFNWTNGCIALNNQQIQSLSRYVVKGTRVLIR